MVTDRVRLPAWAVLVQAIGEQRPVVVRYHGLERLIFPHAIGWRQARAKLLAYQACGGASAGRLAGVPAAGWRSMFVDEVDGAVIADGVWRSARNYWPAPERIGMDWIELAVPAGRALIGADCG